MAMSPNIPQRDPETAGDGGPGHQMTSGDARPYADTDRFGTTQTGRTMPNPVTPQNKVSDPVWGVQHPAGGGNPADPEIPVTKGE